jgi:plastocyanin domain-containing protein
MTLDQIIVTLAGFFLICMIIKFFWMKGKKTLPLTPLIDGIQKQLIIVKGGYTPDTIIVKRDVPVQLTFRREENSSCSEMVQLPDFGKSLKLPEGEDVSVEFTPTKIGEFEFACQMGMLRGKLIVDL